MTPDFQRGGRVPSGGSRWIAPKADLSSGVRLAVPLQNRVTPFGDLVATPERGLVYGNRGCLHDDEGRDGEPWLVRGGELLRWTPGGYADSTTLRGDEALLTPPSLVELLRGGWRGLVPLVHPSANVR